MIVTCPNCDSRYLIKKEQFKAAKRQVRCANCKHVWEYALTDAESEADFSEIPVTPRRFPEAPVKRSSLWQWVFLLCVMSMTGGAFVLGRSTIMDKFPKTKAVYQMAGFSVEDPSKYLKVLSPISESFVKKGESFIRISGKLTNQSTTTRLLPPIAIHVEGPCPGDRKKICRLQTWKHTFAQSRLLPKEELEFETTEALKAKKASKIVLSF